MRKLLRLSIKSILAILFVPLLSVEALTQPLPIQFDQAQNGKASAFPITWTNGILNATHTTYYEGVSTPQRLFLWNLDATNDGTANHHTVKIRHLAEASGKHAYDFLTSWSQAVTEAQNIGGSVNEFGTSGQNLYNGQLDDAPGEFTGANATNFNHAAFINGANTKHKTATYSTASFGTPTGTSGSTDNVLSCWTGIYGAPFFEIAGNEEITSFSVTAEPGYTDEYKIYTLSWSSASDRVLILFAGHPAVGQTTASPICGYGSGQGAGSVNGGSYHIKLDYRDGNIGERDNQVMANTFIIPPTCGLENGTVGCAETPSFTFSFSGTNAANATIKFYFVSNSAGAQLPNATTAISNGDCGSNTNFYSTTTDANGNASITVTPSGSTFIAGGSFQLGACITTGGGTGVCVQENSTTIEDPSVVARANGQATTCAAAYELNTNQANPQVTLTALGTLGGIQDNSLFSSFVWSLPTAGEVSCGVNNATLSNLSATSGGSITFTPTAALGGGFVAGLYAFKVTATTGNGCVSTTLVFINASGGASCPGDTGPISVCQNATALVYTANLPSPGQFLTYVWSISPSNAATIDGADADGTKSAVDHISVTVGTVSFTVILSIKADNGQVFTFNDCQKSVTVHACGSNCTLTQGFFGSTNGKDCVQGLTATPLINSLLGQAPLTVGGINRSVTVPVGSGSTLNSIMPGGNTPGQLACTGDKTISSDLNSLFGQCYLTNVGSKSKPSYKINNVLLAQTITLALNIRYDGTLSGLEVPVGTFTTYARASCPAGAPVCFSGQSFTIPASVSTYLGSGATVQNLLDLANAVLNGGSQTQNGATVTPSEVNNAVDAINKGFDKCRTTEEPTGCIAPTVVNRSGVEPSTAATKMSVTAYPNPYDNSINFSISSATAGRATLEVFDLLGRKMGVVYEGNIESGRGRSISYLVPMSQRVPMIYKLTVGTNTVYGKLLPRGKK
jgi:hypothetical protein